MSTFSQLIQRPSDVDDMIVGSDIAPSDLKRLSGQYLTVFNVVKDGRWRYPDQIASETGVRLDSALRQVRRMKQRGHGYEKNPEGNGLYAYRITASFQE